MAKTYDRDNAARYWELVAMVGKAFSPAAPITSRDLFAGRKLQFASLVGVVNQRGQHAIIYGERGVGKTSLAKVMAVGMSDEKSCSVIYTCSSSDTFSSIWRGITKEITFTTNIPGVGFNTDDKEMLVSAEQLLMNESVSPDDARRALTLLSASIPLMVFIDEFDRPTDGATRTLFADTIKILSDQGVDATIVPVGVGDTVTDLIAEHASIARSLVQVQMPRMDEDELAQIIERGMDACEMEMDDVVVDDIVTLSQGLPHYTHLLAQSAARVAVETGRLEVQRRDLVPAVEVALEGTSETVRETYHRATYSNRETIYQEVLLACALADTDDVGTFGAPDVRMQLRRITHKDYGIPAFAAHLKDFSSSGPRGGILQKRGTSRRFRYRFIDPLLPPYVVMKGRKDGLIKSKS